MNVKQILFTGLTSITLVGCSAENTLEKVWEQQPPPGKTDNLFSGDWHGNHIEGSMTIEKGGSIPGLSNFKLKYSQNNPSGYKLCKETDQGYQPIWEFRAVFVVGRPEAPKSRSHRMRILCEKFPSDTSDDNDFPRAELVLATLGQDDDAWNEMFPLREDGTRDYGIEVAFLYPGDRWDSNWGNNYFLEIEPVLVE